MQQKSQYKIFTENKTLNKLKKRKKSELNG